jgi:hypothetical protein
LDVRFDDLGIIQGKGQRIEDLGWPELWVTFEDGLHLYAISKEGIDPTYGHTGAGHIGTTAKNGRLDANMRMRNEYDWKWQGRTSRGDI